MHLRSRITRTLAFAAALLFALPLAASAAPPRAIPGELLIRFKKDTGPSERAALRAQMNAQRLNEFKFIDVEHVKITGMTDDEAIRRFGRDPRVQYVEPNYEYTIDLTPNDQHYPELYGMHNTGQTGGTPGADIHAQQAWDLFTGDPNIKIGIIDTGIDYNHPDLADNVWTNPGEIPGNGIDDDGNGYVDDVHGYDFVNHDGDPFDDNGHGSHVAGTIAGVGNNSIGVVGVNWHAKVIGIKFLSAAGSGSTADAVSGIQYAIAVGCRLTSNSWGGGGFSQTLLDAINAAGTAGQLFVAAAGNSAQNTDVTPSYPASYNSAYIISVAATDHNDNLASFSNYGATTVDIAAPGVDILSCAPGGGYRLLSGTSMATPHVSGAVALAMGRFPSASNLQIKQLILNAADVKPQLQGKVLTNGRLNAFMSIAEPDNVPPGAISDLVTVSPSSNAIGLAWTATGDDGNTGRASSYEIRYSTTPITDLASFLAATLVPGTPDPHPAGTAESFEVTGLGFDTAYYFALRAKDEFGNPGPVSNVATGTTLGIPNLSASPPSFSASLLTGGTSIQTLTLSNTAAGTLDFTIPTPDLQFTQPAPYPYVPVAKGGDDTRTGDPVIAGHGGPDGFGYRWVDSHDAGGPAFSWVDITGVGTQLTLTGDDAWSASVPLGMSFPFYGGTFTDVRVQTNGFLSFTETTGDYYDNQPLPTSGAPANLVAPFWDDQDFGSTRRVYTYFDGSRFIVSWIGVPHYSAGGPYSYQAILYPSGEIVFQYLSMGTPTNSATVGIQNGAKSVGLTVAFNAAYVQDGLAVRIAPLHQWLTVTPTSGRILAGASRDIQVAFDATGMDGGAFDGTIHILSNDPDGSPTDLPAHLNVTGAPDIALSPSTVDFGTFFVGANPTRVLHVNNPGTDALDVTNLSTGDPDVHADATAFTVAAHSVRDVTLTFSPATARTLAATLSIDSNDPDTPHATVSLTGAATPAPAFAVDPTSFDVSLLTNTATTRNLRISNSGGSNYVFTAATELVGQSGTVVVHGDADNVDVPKGGVDVQSGPTPLRAGGPDVFGYTYKDSDEPGGPTFGWVDISAVGTPIPLGSDDQTLGPFPIGFGFPFYGTSQSQFKICSNGWLSFSSTTSTAYSNTTLPNTGSGVPPSMLAVFWDDLTFSSSTSPNSRAWYYYDGVRTIVQYRVPRLSDGSHLNDFEVLLYPNGQIVYQYLSMTATTLNSATIGIQNDLRNDGLQVAYNAAYVKNSLAIRFTPPARFLTVTPTGGTVPPGGFLDLTVGFNAAALFGGDYLGNVKISGNDPVQPQRAVPAALHVTGVPDVAVNPGSIDFGIAYLGFPQLRQVTVLNTGTDVLHVTNVTFDEPSYGVDQTVFDVPPLGSAVLFVAFHPTVVGAHNATMTIASNDPDTPGRTVALSGQGLVAPDARPDPTSIATTVDIPAADVHTLTVHNDGGSDLNYVIGTQISASSVTVYDELALDKEVLDPRPGILGSGGPDVFGYTWRDSDEPGGPAFDWVDITSIGTAVSFTNRDDGNTAGIPIGFDFPFYGNAFNTVNVCTNGWLSFTSTGTSLANQPLPNSGSSVPENLLAAFWDDIDQRTAGAVYRYADGTRFILEYVGVPHYSSGGPYTFEVILYPSGRIVYQYLSMGSPTNSATVGIQNAARDDGLTVAFNTAYVHDGLAVEIATLPEYLTVSPTTGTVPAGGSADLAVSFNTSGLFGGTYHGNVRIQSNDPAKPVVNVPTTLTAVGVPNVAAAPASLDFGPVYLSLHKDLTLMVRNLGSDVLTIDGATLTNPDYSLVGTETFPIALGDRGAHTFTLRFTPAAACDPCTGELRIASNDPDTPVLAVPLTGAGVVPPEIAVAPASLRAALATTLGPSAIQTTKLLIIDNTGGSDLTWSAEALSQLPMTVTTESGETGKDQPGTPGALGTGGPDAFGYRWADSDDPVQGVPFQWVDITSVGTPVSINGDDRNSGPIALPFPFTFYGNTFSSIRVCSNGWVSFTSSKTTYTNVALPNAATDTPENLLAAFWDDLTLSSSGKAYTYYDGEKFIIEYAAVPRLGSGGPYTFEILLYPSGTIDYQYLSMAGTRLNEATIGIQNGTRDVGLTVVYNAAYVKNNLRVRFSNRPGWLSVAPLSGVTHAGQRDTLRVAFDATGLADGDYHGTVRITSNDLDEPLTTVPCDLHVGVAAARFYIDPNALNRNSNGRWVTGLIVPPTGFTPQDVVVPSVLVQRAVPAAPGAPVAYDDTAAVLKFDRAALLAVLPNGESVPVEAIGRVDDATWFAATDVIRVLRPRVTASGGSSTVMAGGMPEQLSYTASVWLSLIDPPDATATSFDLWYSVDLGETWVPVALGITSHEYLWQVPDVITESGLLDLEANDALGVMGGYLTNVFAVLSGSAGVDGAPPPDRFALRFAGRNPAPRATLEFGLPTSGEVTVRVFDVRGALVRELARGTFEAGWHRLQWDGSGASGSPMQPGIYFVRANGPGVEAMKRFVLIR